MRSRVASAKVIDDVRRALMVAATCAIVAVTVACSPDTDTTAAPANPL